MADRNVPSVSVRLVPEDHQWLARFAKHEGVTVHALINHAVWHFRNWQETGKNLVEEVLKGIEILCREYDRQLRLRYSMRRAYHEQLRRQHNLRRTYEKELWRERNVRRQYEKQLWRERSMRLAYQQQLQRQREFYERREGAGTETFSSAPYSPKVARLLLLAVCSDSDGEANVAFAKARALHRVIA